MSTAYTVCFVCSGNICRSPLGEAVLREVIERAGLADRVTVCSAGTGPWHVGEGADERAIAVAEAAGLDLSDHRAQMVTAEHVAATDLVLALDRGHERALRRMAPDADIRLVRTFDPAAVAADDLEVSDPYYGSTSDFRTVLTQLEDAAPGILAHIQGQMR